MQCTWHNFKARSIRNTDLNFKDCSPAQEQIELEKAIAAAQAMEVRLLEEKRIAGAALLKEVMAGNAVMIEHKKRDKALDVEEDLRILAYTREQDAKAQVSTAACLRPQHNLPEHAQQTLCALLAD